MASAIVATRETCAGRAAAAPGGMCHAPAPTLPYTVSARAGMWMTPACVLPSNSQATSVPCSTTSPLTMTPTSTGSTIAGIAALYAFGRSTRGPVDFNEAHAIDVESMGLYWHFVDIVWIVIFTAVYLLEYL